MEVVYYTLRRPVPRRDNVIDLEAYRVQHTPQPEALLQENVPHHPDPALTPFQRLSRAMDLLASAALTLSALLGTAAALWMLI